MSKPSQPTRLPIEPGATLADRYLVVDVIGEGGMGVVYECKHMKLGTRVAVKMLLDDAAEDEEIRVRFDREARAAARLKSPHVARVLDVDETADGRPFMVMEFLEGYGLDEVVETVEVVGITEAVDYVLQACSGMAEAHAHGIVHRDLKPPNLFCAMDGGEARLKVLDFGISKVLLPGEQKGVTHTTTTFGTPTYMSPEQIQSAKNVDARADVWSLGVILYELLVGFPPFDGDNPGAIIWSICSDDPKPPRQLRSDIPKGLSEVVMVALEKDREYRFQSVTELAEALESYGTEGVFMPPSERNAIPLPSRSSRRNFATVASAPTIPRDNSHKPSHPPWTSSRRLSIRRTKTALIAGVATMVALVGGGIALLVTQQQAAAPLVESSVPSPAVTPLQGPAVTASEVVSAAPEVTAAPEGAATATPSASAEAVEEDPPPRPAAAPEKSAPPAAAPVDPGPPPAKPPAPQPAPKPPPKPPSRDPHFL